MSQVQTLTLGNTLILLLVSSQDFSHNNTCHLYETPLSLAPSEHIFTPREPKLKTNEAGRVGLDRRFENITIAPYQTKRKTYLMHL